MSYKNTPRFPGLARISIYALAPTLVILCIAGYEGSRWVVHQYLTHSAIRSAFTNRFTDTIVQVERARSLPSLYDLIGFKDQSDIHIQSEALVALKLCAQIGTATAQQNFQSVDHLIEEVTNARPILESISRANSFYVWTNIKEKVPAWQNVIRKLSIVNAHKHRSEELDRLKKKFIDLKEQLMMIIVVPFDRLDDQMSFYTEGVLTELPVINGIPDALNSLEELRDSLKRVNGRVSIPKNIEDPKTYFIDKLDGFRMISKEIRSHELFSAITTTPTNVEETERRSVQLTNELLQEIGLLVSKLVVNSFG